MFSEDLTHIIGWIFVIDELMTLTKLNMMTLTKLNMSLFILFHQTGTNLTHLLDATEPYESPIYISDRNTKLIHYHSGHAVGRLLVRLSLPSSHIENVVMGLLYS